MYGQNDHLSGQTFSLPVILTGNEYSVSDCKKKKIYTIKFPENNHPFSLNVFAFREVKFHVYVKWQHEFVLPSKFPHK